MAYTKSKSTHVFAVIRPRPTFLLDPLGGKRAEQSQDSRRLEYLNLVCIRALCGASYTQTLSQTYFIKISTRHENLHSSTDPSSNEQQSL